jgi:cell volume regulation protein A
VTDATEFGRVVLIVAAGFAAAILSTRATKQLRVPAPALFLFAAAVSSDIIPEWTPLLSVRDVERACLVALIVILFAGGMEIGRERFRRSLLPVAALGIVGTFLVFGLLSVAVHALLRTSWTVALLIGAALAPTDPAVMFSVLGDREVEGRSDDILKGESGVNDPVAIALVIGLLDHATGRGTELDIAGRFLLELGVGGLAGVLGGLALARLLRVVSLPDAALAPLLMLAGAGAVFGVAAVLHGSGFLAVFVAGIMVADVDVPFRAEIDHFHTALASLAEMVVFVALGLTIDIGSLDLTRVWLDGILVAVVLTFLARPAVVALLLARAALLRGEKAFIAWAGMRGAVPILLAAFAKLDGVDGANRIYGVVFVVVMFSVLVQGSLVEPVARRCGLQLRAV